MHDHRISLRDVGDRAPHLVHPTGVLVPERVGQLDPALLLPLALDDVEVRTAQPCAADPDDHIERVGDLRLGDFLDGGPLP
jgi:hypothetical protein